MIGIFKMDAQEFAANELYLLKRNFVDTRNAQVAVNKGTGYENASFEIRFTEIAVFK
jgi:hypothetical protein